MRSELYVPNSEIDNIVLCQPCREASAPRSSVGAQAAGFESTAIVEPLRKSDFKNSDIPIAGERKVEFDEK